MAPTRKKDGVQEATAVAALDSVPPVPPPAPDAPGKNQAEVEATKLAAPGADAEEDMFGDVVAESALDIQVEKDVEMAITDNEMKGSNESNAQEEEVGGPKTESQDSYVCSF